MIFKNIIFFFLFSNCFLTYGTESSLRDDIQKRFLLNGTVSSGSFVKILQVSQKQAPVAVHDFPLQFHTWSAEEQKNFVLKMLTKVPPQQQKTENHQKNKYIMLREWVNDRLMTVITSSEDQRVSNLTGFLNRENIPIFYIGDPLDAAIHKTDENIKRLEEFVQEVRTHSFKPIPKCGTK